MNFYKKLIVSFIMVIVVSIFIIKLSISSIEGKLIEISKSEKFYNFVDQRIKFELDKLSSKNLTEEDVLYYSDRLKKIIIKWQPVLDEIQ
jgi:hypothetical protein|tara:strand:- start:428 stop:697 length:270 start_codon:yes stop_codon:yes gene_type:complete